MMLSRTFDELLTEASSALKDAGIQNSRFEARLLLKRSSGRSREYLMLHGSEEAGEDVEVTMIDYVNRRAPGEPLQYILGEWMFMGDTYRVGKVVLIPRPETELLVELAIEDAPDRAVVFDVCAGTGCIGISTALRRRDLDVYCLEKYEEAFGYLTENIALRGVKNVKAVRADVFADVEATGLPKPDMILSNPPYVKRGEMAWLQREVKCEPAFALDGGEDGLVFYRALAQKWFPFLKRDGILAMECGDGQAGEVRSIFSGLSDNIESINDYNGIERFVTVRKD